MEVLMILSKAKLGSSCWMSSGRTRTIISLSVCWSLKDLINSTGQWVNRIWAREKMRLIIRYTLTWKGPQNHSTLQVKMHLSWRISNLVKEFSSPFVAKDIRHGLLLGPKLFSCHFLQGHWLRRQNLRIPQRVHKVKASERHVRRKSLWISLEKLYAEGANENKIAWYLDTCK